MFSGIAQLAHADDAVPLPLNKLSLPDGFKIETYATEVKNARQMALGDKGTVFVGSRSAGVVNAVVDTNADGKADQVIEIASGLNMPSGVTFKNGALYVAEVHQILKFPNIEENLKKPPKPEVVVPNLPKERHHGWKNIDFGPDGWLYVPVGTPCNVCMTAGSEKFDDPRFDSILKFNLKTGEQKWVAKGVRNSVGFDWHPKTGDFWFSDNGRDWLGDDLPPCEINHVSEHGQHFGYPYFFGSDVADPEFGKGKKASDFRAPALDLQAHVAPLGIHFYEGNMYPKSYKNRLFVAEHGSWNRSSKVGYRVMMATLDGNKITKYEPFIQGWLQDGDEVWGRPVALLPLPDGSLLVSDDFANAIYRITYHQ
nr:PQQ-dependent sugar dehydrogenase [Alteromonas sp. a30]